MKKDEIIRLKRENPDMTGDEIASEVNTNPAYVYEVWNDDKPVEEPAAEPDRGEPDDDLGGGIDLGDLGDEPDRGGPDQDEPDKIEIDDDDPLRELFIEDTHDSYECSDCGGEVGYLDKRCKSCGEELAWWSA